MVTPKKVKKKVVVKKKAVKKPAPKKVVVKKKVVQKPVPKKVVAKKPVAKKTTSTFRSSFASAKKSGKKTFVWKGKKYTTQTAEEKALNMTDKKLKQEGSDAYGDAKVKMRTVKSEFGGTSQRGFSSKSHNEIMNSYTNEENYRRDDKVKKLAKEQGVDISKYKNRDKVKGKPRGSAFAEKRPNRLKKKK